MASKPRFKRAQRLGRSSVTGQFVLKPVGNRSRKLWFGPTKAQPFNLDEARILRLAATNMPNWKISTLLEIPESNVRETLEKAKNQYRTTRKVSAARAYLREMSKKDTGESPAP